MCRGWISIEQAKLKPKRARHRRQASDCACIATAASTKIAMSTSARPTRYMTFSTCTGCTAKSAAAQTASVGARPKAQRPVTRDVRFGRAGTVSFEFFNDQNYDKLLPEIMKFC